MKRVLLPLSMILLSSYAAEARAGAEEDAARARIAAERKRAEGAGEAGDAEDTDDATLEMSRGGVVDLAFGSNLDKLGTACHRDEPSGCAIYTATLDLDNKTVKGVRLLDRHESMGTWFPTWYPTGEFVIFEQVQWKGEQTNVIIATRTDNHSRSLLTEKGRFPSVNSDGSRLLWSLPTSSGGVLMGDIKIGEKGGMVIQNERNLTEDRVAGKHHGEDAQFVPGTDQIVFHQKGDNTMSGVISYKDGAPRFPSEALHGCGHTAVSPDGDRFICGLSSGGGTYQSIRKADGSWTEMEPIFPALTQSDYAAANPAYGDEKCDRLLMSYPEFCATTDRLIASGQCATTEADGGATIQFSRLLLIEFDPDDSSTPAQITDLSSLIEAAANAAPGSSQAVTASCRVRG